MQTVRMRILLLLCTRGNIVVLRNMTRSDTRGIGDMDMDSDAHRLPLFTPFWVFRGMACSGTRL